MSGAAAVAAPLLAPFEVLANTDSLGIFGARGNADLIRESGIQVRRLSSEVLGHSVDLLEFRKESRGTNTPLFIPHSNEFASFDAALRNVAQVGGTVLAFDSRGGRQLRTSSGRQLEQDPNRMFKPNSPYWPLAQVILERIDAERGNLPYVALHNNSPAGTFVLNVAKALKDPRFETFFPDARNLRDVVWMSLPVTARNSPHPLRGFAEQLASKGINSLIEYVVPETASDGSLSQYTGRTSTSGYINIESGFRGGDPEQVAARTIQTKVLEELKTFLASDHPVL